jgi:hypothetical protein
MKKAEFKAINMIFLMQTEEILVKAFEDERFSFDFEYMKMLVESNCLNYKALLALKRVFKKHISENLEMLEKFNSISVERNIAKYILIHVEERNGEREYTSKIVRQIDGSVDAHNWADEKIAKTWLDFDSEENDNGYFFNGGEFLVHISKIEEITKEDFDILSKYL